MSDRLKTISYTDERAKEIVESFCGHVHWLVRVRHTYRVLFEDKQPSCQTLMEKTASWFFADLNRILQEYLLLECAKITDPATTGNHENFTVDCLVRNICWPNDKAILRKLTSLPDDDKNILKELESLRAITEEFRSYIGPARNKFLPTWTGQPFYPASLLVHSPRARTSNFLARYRKFARLPTKPVSVRSTVTCHRSHGGVEM